MRPVPRIHGEMSETAWKKDTMATEQKTALKQFVSEELMTIVEDSLHDIPGRPYHNSQSGFRSVVYDLVEPVMLYLRRRGIIGETLDDRISKLLGTDAAREWLPKKFLTSRSFMEPLVTFVQH